jgi:hypothetical protein
VFGNAFTAEKPPAFRAFRSGFTDMVIETPLLTDAHVNSLAETYE